MKKLLLIFLAGFVVGCTANINFLTVDQEAEGLDGVEPGVPGAVNYLSVDLSGADIRTKKEQDAKTSLPDMNLTSEEMVKKPSTSEPADEGGSEEPVTPEEPEEPEIIQPYSIRESADYTGRANGNRPHFRFTKPMSAYPKKFTFVADGGYTHTVTNNGVRYQHGQFVAKDGHETKKLVIVAPSSVKARGGFITW